MTDAQVKELLGSLMITLRIAELKALAAEARIAELSLHVSELEKQLAENASDAKDTG